MLVSLGWHRAKMRIQILGAPMLTPDFHLNQFWHGDDALPSKSSQPSQPSRMTGNPVHAYNRGVVLLRLHQWQAASRDFDLAAPWH